MIYVLIAVSLAILLFLLYQQKQSQVAWQKELADLAKQKELRNRNDKAATGAAEIDEKPIVVSGSNRQTHESITPELPFFLEEAAVETIESTENQSNKTDSSKNKKAVKDDLEPQATPITPELFAEMPYQHVPIERETISYEEATRFLRRPLAEVEQEDNFRPDVMVKADEKLPIITLDDPNIARVRHRTRAETRLLLQKDNPTATKPATASNHDESESMNDAADTSEAIDTTLNEETYLSNWSARERKMVIDAEDIHDNLARQRDAKQKLAAKHASRWQETDMPVASASMEEIPADEVWANLSKKRISPLQRKRNQIQHNVSAQNTTLATAEMEPITNLRYPSSNPPEYGVSIAEPVVVPRKPMPEPEIVEPVFFTDAPQPEPQAWQSDENETPEWDSESNFQAASTESTVENQLSEEDFSQFYQQQNDHNPNEAQANSDSDSWSKAWAETSSLPENTIPPLSLLLPPVHDPEAVQSPEALLENSIIIEEKLAEFRVKVKVLDAYAGPVITRYEIEPDVGVRGNSVLNLEKDLARSLGVAAIRVVETIPGKTCMGLELPNPKRQMIRLSEVFNSPAFSGSPSKLTLALGQDITGAPVVTDLAKAPHLLVAGTTGSGKSVGVNSMILSMLYKSTPEEVRLIMIDPKMLELSIYEGIPHLLAPVVTDMKLAANALTWCVNEMEKRYRLMSHVGVRNLEGYNQKIREAAQRGQKIGNPFSLTPQDPEPLEKLPFIVVVVDEFADLMMVAGKQIEQLIARLAQKARAAGIHLILATQRPSVDVITGLIKANIPTRIAFQVSTKIDSRTILDQMGAENLLGQGDMLFLPPGTGYPQRVHGAFVADNEVHAIVEYLKQFGEPNYVNEILAPEQEEFNFGGGGIGSSERDPLFDQAVEFIISSKKTSISSLQRHLRIGYNKAATLMDQLEAEGIISAADHVGRRTILARGTSAE